MSCNSRIIPAMLLFLFAFALKGSAQNYEVIDLEVLLNSTDKVQKSSTQKSRSTKNYSEVEVNTAQVRALVYDLKPTIYIEDQEIKQFENESPEIADVAINSLAVLEENNRLFSNIELLKLKLNADSGNIKLDLNNLKSFSSLKYIYVECSYSCSISNIQNMFSNTGNIKILYMVTQPE